MLIYNNIQAQQNANNAQRTMKKEQGNIRLCPHFFFSLSFVGHHAFVEDKLSTYQAIYQCVMCYIQHFNAFTPVNKSVGKRLDAPSHYVADMPSCRQADMPPCRHENMVAYRHGGMTYNPDRRKRKKHPATTDSAADFLQRKSHSLLGRFLHAPLR